MTWLYIVCGVLAFLLAAATVLLFSRVTVRVTYAAQTLQASIKSLVFRRKYEFSFAKKPEETAATETAVKKPAKKTEEQAETPASEIIKIVKELIAELFGHIKKRIRLERYIVKVRVASDDVAKTGVLYGAVCGAAAGLYEIVRNFPHASKKDGRIVTEVIPDFIGEKTDLLIDIAISASVLDVLKINRTVSGSYSRYLKLKSPAETAGRKDSGKA